MNIRQSEFYAKYLRSLGWIVEKTSFGNVFIKKILFFSVIKIQRVYKINLDELKKIKNKYHPILINYEPLKDNDLKIPGQSLLPTKTVILDLENLRLPKDTKYEIKKSQKNLKLEISTDIKKFYDLLKETMKLGGWQIPIKNEVISLYKAFQPNNSAILSTDGSACLLIWAEDTAHFMYAANNKQGLESGGAYFILNEAIKFCQNKKLKYLDLEGIYDERFPDQNKNWQGFTKFKMGWGGKIIEYPKPKLAVSLH